MTHLQDLMDNGTVNEVLTDLQETEEDTGSAEGNWLNVSPSKQRRSGSQSLAKQATFSIKVCGINGG